MECQDARAHIADYLAGTLPAEELGALQAHAAVCTACRDELTAAQETWQLLGRIPPLTPDGRTMQTRFDAVVAGYQERLGSLPRRPSTLLRRRALVGLAAAALFLIGVAIGRQTARPTPVPDTQIAALRGEVGQLRQMISLALLQQQSAIARLQGVVSTRQIEDPSGEVVSALLDTLMNDPNANVRLATVDALKRLMDRDPVKRGTLEALSQQTSPLVQIALIDFVAESAGAESAEALRTLSKDATVQDVVRMRAAERLRQLGVRS